MSRIIQHYIIGMNPFCQFANKKQRLVKKSGFFAVLLGMVLVKATTFR
jgi:hypothetical protein